MNNKEVFLFREHKKSKEIDVTSFKFVRAYHACRPESLDSYLNDGLKPYERDEVLAIILKRTNGLFSTNEVERVFNKFWEEKCKYGYDKYVFFSLEKAPFVYSTRPGIQHYLIYGSEFILSVINSLCSTTYTARRLLNVGIPTLITCNVPVERIHPDWLHFGFHYIDGLRTYRIPPEYIIKVEHPAGTMYDPIQCRVINLTK